MATTLQTYITLTRRLLHDANANFWSDSELTDDINNARNRLIRDTGVNRIIQNTVAVQNQELYTFDNTAGYVSGILVTNAGSGYTAAPNISLTASPTGNNATATATISQTGTYGSNTAGAISGINLVNPGLGYTTAPTVTITSSDGNGSGGAAQAFLAGMPQGNLTMDIININLYWGNTRIPLRYLPWTQFNAELRFWQNYVGRPIAYSMYGAQSFYLSPVPDQNYSMEIDTIVEPTNLVNLSDVEQNIPAPWQDPVPYYAAHVAKFKEQSYGEAELFKNQYQAKMLNLESTTFTRRMPDPYSRPY
jgi:hypothetical protein